MAIKSSLGFSYRFILIIFSTLYVSLLTGCSKDNDAPTETSTTSKDDIYSTVTMDELPELFSSTTTNIQQGRSSSETPFIVPDLSQAYQDELIGTEAKVTVVPSTTTHANVYSRILLLRVNDTVRNVAFHLIPDPTAVTNSFTGRYIITDLQGTFIDGYKVEDRHLVSRYKLSSVQRATTSRTNPEGCEYFVLTCGEQDLDEVFIDGDVPIDGDGGGGYVDIPWTPNPGNNNNTEPDDDNYGGGSGGNNNPTNYEPVEDCGPDTSYHIALNACDEEQSPCGEGFTLNEQNECVEDDYYNAMDKICQKNIVIDFFTNTDTDIINTINSIFFGNDDYNLEFIDVNINSSLNAVASTVLPAGLSFNQNTAATIRYDNSYLDNSSNLSIVLETSHELIHVYLTYLYSEGDLLMSYPNFTDMNEAFENFNNNPSSSTYNLLQDSMHAEYDNFLGWIQDSVYSYATDNNMQGVTEDYIEKMVIGSHQNTEAFQNLSDDQKTEYSTIAHNEQNGTNDAKGSKCD